MPSPRDTAGHRRDIETGSSIRKAPLVVPHLKQSSATPTVSRDSVATPTFRTGS